jgi:hypothetical protein
MTIELGPNEYIEEFLSEGPKNYAYKTVNARTSAKKTASTLRGITLNYADAHLVYFDSIFDMILGANARDVITVRTDRKSKRKMRKCDGSGLVGTDTVTIVSEPEENV